MDRAAKATCRPAPVGAPALANWDSSSAMALSSMSPSSEYVGTPKVGTLTPLMAMIRFWTSVQSRSPSPLGFSGSAAASATSSPVGELMFDGPVEVVMTSPLVDLAGVLTAALLPAPSGAWWRHRRRG